MLNVPTERLHFVARSTDNIISLAARIILYQRGESTDEPLEKIPRV